MFHIEVLIINDGSTDNTACIAARYPEKYPEIFRLVNKENGGHGSAVNCGISEAKGKYFKTVDGDDWVDTGALRELIDLKDLNIKRNINLTMFVVIYI